LVRELVAGDLGGSLPEPARNLADEDAERLEQARSAGLSPVMPARRSDQRVLARSWAAARRSRPAVASGWRPVRRVMVRSS
jgi:hypothetical protein